MCREAGRSGAQPRPHSGVKPRPEPSRSILRHSDAPFFSSPIALLRPGAARFVLKNCGTRMTVDAMVIGHSSKRDGPNAAVDIGRDDADRGKLTRRA